MFHKRIIIDSFGYLFHSVKIQAMEGFFSLLLFLIGKVKLQRNERHFPSASSPHKWSQQPELSLSQVRSQEPPWPPNRHRFQGFGPSSKASPSHNRAAGSEVEHPGCELVPHNDAGAESWGLACYTTQPALEFSF